MPWDLRRLLNIYRMEQNKVRHCWRRPYSPRNSTNATAHRSHTGNWEVDSSVPIQTRSGKVAKSYSIFVESSPILFWFYSDTFLTMVRLSQELGNTLMNDWPAMEWVIFDFLSAEEFMNSIMISMKVVYEELWVSLPAILNSNWIIFNTFHVSFLGSASENGMMIEEIFDQAVNRSWFDLFFDLNQDALHPVNRYFFHAGAFIIVEISLLFPPNEHHPLFSVQFGARSSVNIATIECSKNSVNFACCLSHFSVFFPSRNIRKPNGNSCKFYSQHS